MKIESKFDKDYDYSGKWCLFKKSYTSPISSIFIIENMNGFVRFVYENSSSDIKYEEEEYFLDCCLFTLSPFKTYKFNEFQHNISSDLNTPKEISNKSCRYNYCSQENHKSCKHYKNGYCRCGILTSEPPQYHSCSFEFDIPIYEYCGKVDGISI